MDFIGEFTIKAVDDMCKQCTKRKLQLDSCSYGTVDGDIEYTYVLHCENAEQCRYAYEQGKITASSS